MPHPRPLESSSSTSDRAEGGLELGPALEFMRLLWRLNHALELTSFRTERALGITAQQRLVIRCLGRQPGTTPSQLAALLHLDRSTISTALNRMEQDGLVVKRGDERDGRRVTLWLSTKGRRLDHPWEGTLESAVERMLEATPKGDILTVERAIARLATELESSENDSSGKHPVARRERPRTR